jgi:hypothetical protein
LPIMLQMRTRTPAWSSIRGKQKLRVRYCILRTDIRDIPGLQVWQGDRDISCVITGGGGGTWRWLVTGMVIAVCLYDKCYYSVFGDGWRQVWW